MGSPGENILLYFPRISIALIYSERNLRGKDRKSWSKKKKKTVSHYISKVNMYYFYEHIHYFFFHV